MGLGRVSTQVAAAPVPVAVAETAVETAGEDDGYFASLQLPSRNPARSSVSFWQRAASERKPWETND